MNTMIFTEVHLLAGKLLLVVAIHSLGGSQGCYVNANDQESELEPAMGLK